MCFEGPGLIEGQLDHAQPTASAIANVAVYDLDHFANCRKLGIYGI